VTGCFRGSLQPDEEVESSSGSEACCLGDVDACENECQLGDSGPSAQSVTRGVAMGEGQMSNGISPLQQAAIMNHTVSDGISPLQQAASIYHTDMQHSQRGTEAFENVTHLNRTEAKYPASSHRQVFPASSSQRRSPTPFPHFTALTDARLGRNESQLEYPSVANPVQRMSVHVPRHTPETGGASGRETTGMDPNANDTRSRMDPKLFLNVVNSQLCFRCCH